ncbi:hypothetical protein ACRWY4_23340, partial [Escherichia coli]
MKLIPRSSDISPDIDGICPGPFPPNGFTVLTDAAYGNGDCFGLYWPIGQEHKLPIVCETYHDEWRIVPAFSSIKKFEEWLEVNDDDPHENGISIEDQDFAANLFRVARKCLSTGRLNRPGFPGECFICELRLPDHRFRWKHNKLFLLL